MDEKADVGKFTTVFEWPQVLHNMNVDASMDAKSGLAENHGESEDETIEEDVTLSAPACSFESTEGKSLSDFLP